MYWENHKGQFAFCCVTLVFTGLDWTVAICVDAVNFAVFRECLLWSIVTSEILIPATLIFVFHSQVHESQMTVSCKKHIVSPLPGWEIRLVKVSPFGLKPIVFELAVRASQERT